MSEEKIIIELCSLLKQGKNNKEKAQQTWNILETKLEKEYPKIFQKIMICPNCQSSRDILFDNSGKIAEIMCLQCLDYLSPEELIKEICDK